MNSAARTTPAGRQIVIRLAAPVILTGLLVAACSSSGTTSGTTSGAASASPRAPSPAAGQAAFTQCLRKNGITLPAGTPTFKPGQTPGPGQLPTGIGQGKTGKAFQACLKFAPAGFGAGGGNGGTSGLTAFTGCMKDHGVTVTGTGLSALQALGRRGGQTGKAFKACRALLP